MDSLMILPAAVTEWITALAGAYPDWACWYRTAVRFLFPVLAVLILGGAVRSLLTVPYKSEIWGYLGLPNGANIPLTHWENILGRAPSSDVVLGYPTVSRQHAALIRGSDGTWTVYDLQSKGGVQVNRAPVASRCQVKYGDVITLGGVETVLLPVTEEEKIRQQKSRNALRPAPPWRELILLTLFQALTMLQLTLAGGGQASAAIPAAFAGLTMLMWIYVLTLRACRREGFEMEVIAFFLTTLNLAVTASSNAGALFKQLLSVILGLILFLVLSIFLRDLDRVKQIRWMMAGGAILLCGMSLLLGKTKFGASNWVEVGGMSLQPSELAKICYIFAGSATLERLFRRRNLGLFLLLTAVCLGSLALMSDFGTAAVFFVTFLVIAFLRSGDYATLGLITGGGVFGALVVLSAKPYVMRRFAVWGHAWQHASEGGYQQTRTMSAAASGGLVGVGPGEGWLHRITAADTDLVFGMLCEEWGLIIAALGVLSIVTLAVFAVRCCQTGRSSFYTISACAATSLLVFQTALNVFGSVDLLPLTGVTFPFVSNGGTSMVCSWGLLAFLKATDTRPRASISIRLSAGLNQEKGWLGPKAADLEKGGGAGSEEN